MIVETLVLMAALLSIIAVIVSFVPQRRVLALDESQIDTATQLECCNCDPTVEANQRISAAHE
jgi:hypothetical protein